MAVVEKGIGLTERLEEHPFGGCTLRVRKARQRRLSARPSVCLDRAKVMTEVFMKTEGEPMVARKAKAFKELCERGTIFIQDGELIVGNPGSRIRAGMLSPDGNYAIAADELDTLSTRPQDPFLITEEQKKLVREFVAPYWKGKSYWDVFKARWSAEMQQLWEGMLLNSGSKTKTGSPSIILADYDRVLRFGINGIKKNIDDRLASLNAAVPGDYEKSVYLKALLIVCDGMEARAGRYASLAREKARAEADPQRRAELEKIAGICERVPMDPAGTFWEALQSLWSYHVFLLMEHNVTSYNPGRMDQYLYPYYKQDIDEGRLTKEQAQELLECLWVKFSEICHLEDAGWARVVPGYVSGQNICCGGITQDGQDGVNELSYMMLQATMDVRLTQPQLAVKYNKAKNPDSFLRKAAELTSFGTGWPTWHNDQVGIRNCLDMGINIEDAYNWNPKGCMEVGLAGKMYNLCSTSQVNTPGVLELVLLNGEQRLTKKRMPVPPTGDPRSYKTYAELERAVKTVLAYLVKKAAEIDLLTEVIGQEQRPVLLASLTYKECIENAKDCVSGGAKYNLGGEVLILGIADIADSLLAIKKLIYDEKRLTWDELLAALAHNFEGYEKVRELCLAVPKYGNDIDEVDEIARDMTQFIAEEVRKYKGLHGGRMQAMSAAAAMHVPNGERVGALPSGRLAGLPLADGMSPMPGTDTKGPTAILKSLSKCRIDLLTTGSLLNMKLDPQFFKGERGIRDFISLIKSWADLGLYHVQFNVVSPQTLKDAQKHPEQYRGLLVRVSGYSAYFVDLDKNIQDDIISRTTIKALS